MSEVVGTQAQEAFCIIERGGVRLAVPVSDVSRVLGRRRVTPIPRAPAYIVGLVSDGVEPVLALRLDPWLAMQPIDAAPTSLVVLRGSDSPIAVVVDRLCGVALLPQEVDASALQAMPPGVSAPIVASYRRGAEGIVPVLAVGALVDAITNAWPGGVRGGGSDGR